MGFIQTSTRITLVAPFVEYSMENGEASNHVIMQYARVLNRHVCMHGTPCVNVIICLK